MPRPRRRRRFFALEGRFEVDDSGELQGVAEPAPETLEAAASPIEETPSTEPGFEPGLPPDDELPPAFRLNRQPHARAATTRSLSPAALLLALGCLLAGLLTGFLWPRPAPKPLAAEANNVQKAPDALLAADQEELDAAYAARHDGNFAEAGRLFAELDHRHPDWGSVRVETGRTLYYAGQPQEATPLLKQAIEKGWKPSEANFLLAIINKGRRSYPDAEARFAKAVALDPTTPDYYFFWGECLREEGKLIEATAKYRSALLRNQYETATGLYRAKLWLCALEADQPGSKVNAEVDAELAGPRPSMEALVAAAARDLKASDLRAAKTHLTAASQRADPVVFRYLLGDPTFADLRTKPEFAGWFQPAPLAPSPSASPTR